MRQSYTEILANAFSEARAWKLTTFVVTGLCAVLAIALIWQSHTTPVVLVPAGFAETQGKVTVQPQTFQGTSPDYLAQVALGDLALILTWQPSNVELQYQRFLNRTTSELYQDQNVKLLADALKHRQTGTSQSFYPENVQVDVNSGRVIVDGYLVRWEGDKEVLRTRSRFTVTYRNQKGFLHVADLKISQ